MHELHLHKGKIQKLTKLSSEEVHELLELATLKLSFLDERLLPDSVWGEANNLIGDIDKKDIPFVALSLHLRGVLWSGDKALHRNYPDVFPN